MVKKSLVAIAAAAVFSLSSGCAMAMASGSVVFDLTNLIQNASQASSSITQISNQLRQLVAQYQQYETMVRQLKSMERAAKVLLNQPGFTEYRNIRTALDAYQDLGRSVSDARRIYSTRLDEARLMGVDWNTYVRVQADRVARNKDGAAARVEAEQRALAKVNDDYEFARDAASKIPNTEGTHAAIQQSNAILNRMVTQNAEIIRALGQANGAQRAEELTRASADQEAKDAATKKILDTQKSMRLDADAAVNAMKSAARASAPR